MADRQISELDPVKEVPIGDLPQVLDIYDDSLIPLEQQGMAMRMTGKQFRQFGEKTAEMYVQTAVDAAETATGALEKVQQAGADAVENVQQAETESLGNIEDKRKEVVQEMEGIRDTTEGYKDAAAESAKDAADVALHPPKIQDGHWWTWDTEANDYTDSGVDAGVSLTVGTVTTGEPGSEAKVTNRGTPTDPILDFTIPRGDVGPVSSVNGKTGDVVISQRNLLLDSGKEIKNGYYNVASFRSPLSDLEVGKPYTITLCVTPGNSTKNISFYKGAGEGNIVTFPVTGGEKQILSYPFTISQDLDDRVPTFVPSVFKYPDDGAITIIHWAVLTEGNVPATDWSPAPEDKQDALTGVKGQVVGFDEGGHAVATNVSVRNLISGTGTPTTIFPSPSIYNFRRFPIINGPLPVGSQYTLSADVVIDAGNYNLVTCLLYDSSMTAVQANGLYIPIVDGHITGTFTVTGTDAVYLLIYAGVAGETANNGITIKNLILTRGTVATDWSPAPEDKQDVPVAFSVTLPVASWANNQQTVTDARFLDMDQYVYDVNVNGLCVPWDGVSITEGQMTVTVDIVPAGAVTVDVVREEVQNG